jgi:hypothetical protein
LTDILDFRFELMSIWVASSLGMIYTTCTEKALL